jgi:hypothetical protein
MLTSMKAIIQVILLLVMVVGIIVLNLKGLVVENLIAGKYGIQINPRHLNQLVITTLIFFILKFHHKNQKQEDLA